MTAPLYDVKAKFSEYITMAEDGEVIEISKHGLATTVIISIKTYNELKSDYKKRNKPGFMEMVNKWRQENSDILDNEFSENIERLVQEDKKIFDTGVNVWD